MKRPEFLRRAIVLLLFIPIPLSAWSRQSEVDIAWEAARLAPADLYRQIVRHKTAYRDGLVAGYDRTEADRFDRSGAEALAAVITAEAAGAVRSIETHQPFRDVVRRLGLLVHQVIEANNPLATSSGTPLGPIHTADFSRYMDSTSPRLPALFYGLDTALNGPDDVPAFVGRATRRSSRLHRYIGQEYERIGGGSGTELFDDRSTAFGIAAVSFSRAMTDVAVMLRYVWLEAGGADSLPRQPLESRNLLRLSRSP